MADRTSNLADLERQAEELVESMTAYRSAARSLQAASDAVVESQRRLDAVEERSKEVLRETQELVSEIAGIDPAALFEQLARAHAANEARTTQATNKLLKVLDERQATARELSDRLATQFEFQSAALVSAFQAAVNSGVVAKQVHEVFAPQFTTLQRELHAQRQQVEYLQQKTFTIIKEEISGVRTAVYDATVGGGLSAQVQSAIVPRLTAVDERLFELQEATVTITSSVREAVEATAASNRLLANEVVPLRLAVEMQTTLLRRVLVVTIVLGVIAATAAML